jgi:hypothetical protein
MNNNSDSSNDDLFEDVTPEQQLRWLYNTPLSISTLFISSIYSGALWTLVAVTPLYGLAAIGALDDECFPIRIQQATQVSGVPVLVRLFYLIGPMTGFISIAVYQFVKKFEKIMRLRAVNARTGSEETANLLAETIALVQKRSKLGERVSTWEPGNTEYDAYSATASEADQRMRELLGPLRGTHLTYLGLVAFNWYAIGLQVYYGIQWGFCSYWLAVPVLAIWIIGALLCSISTRKAMWIVGMLLFTISRRR